MGKCPGRPHIINQQSPRFICGNDRITDGNALGAILFEIQGQTRKIKIGMDQRNGQRGIKNYCQTQ